MAIDALNTYSEVNVTATKNGSGIKVNKGKVALEMRVSKITGTNPTLDIKIQESDDNVTFTDVLTFKQFTAVENRIEYINADKSHIRYVMTVGGTTPDIDMTLYVK